MWIFQAPYNALVRWKCRWFCDLMGWIQINVVWPAMKAVGEAGKELIIEAIKEAAEMDISNEDKFKYVFDKCRASFTVKIISDNLLDTMIQILFSMLKTKGIV